jgi:site-specific recombinase XerD
MQAGGNILTLQKILDHQSLTMTMRYAHLAADHLAEARELNPLQIGRFLDGDKKDPQP